MSSHDCAHGAACVTYDELENSGPSQADFRGLAAPGFEGFQGQGYHPGARILPCSYLFIMGTLIPSAFASFA